MKALTTKQQETFDYIIECIVKDGRQPSLRNIAESLKVNSFSVIRERIIALEKKGYLQRVSNEYGLKILKGKITYDHDNA